MTYEYRVSMIEFTGGGVHELGPRLSELGSHGWRLHSILSSELRAGHGTYFVLLEKAASDPAG